MSLAATGISPQTHCSLSTAKKQCAALRKRHAIRWRSAFVLATVRREPRADHDDKFKATNAELSWKKLKKTLTIAG
jgi:hypothetical protein